MEELIPSIGTTVPSPAVLAVRLCHSESIIQNVSKLCMGASDNDISFDVTGMLPFEFCSQMDQVCKTYLISISDDGKIWNWHLTSNKSEDARKTLNMSMTANIAGEPEKHTIPIDSLVGELPNVIKEPEPPVNSSSSQLINSSAIELEETVKVNGLTIFDQNLLPSTSLNVPYG